MPRLDRLLRPGSIAVFGGKWATAVVRQTLKMGFEGDIWPVHPERDCVEGLRAYRSVCELPGAPDASFVGVNRRQTVEIVRQLADRNAGGATCFAAGFRETGTADGTELEADLLAAAGSMPILGPNCYGLINYADGALLWPDQHGGERLTSGSRGAAIVSQSSNIALNMTMHTRGLPLSHVVTVGNQAQCGISEIALGLIEDDRVSTLGLHIEGFDSIPGFERLAERARELRKPIVAMKVGRSDKAKLATVTHTASLAGSDAVSDAFLRRLGIARVHSAPVFLEALKLLHVAGPTEGRRISSMSCSGGEACLIADSAVGRDLEFPDLSVTHQRKVEQALGPLVAVANPLDYHTFIWNDEAAMSKAFTAFVSGGFDFNLLVLDFPRGDRCQDTDWHATVNAFEMALNSAGAKGGVLATLPENLPERWSAELLARRIAPLNGIPEALEAIECAAEAGEGWRRPPHPPVIRPVAATCRKPVQETEAAAKQKLREAGLAVPPGRIVEDADDAASLAAAIGYPVVVKALGIAHKTEENAVMLDLADEAMVRQAAGMLSRKGAVYVEEMVSDGVCELVVGIARDPQFGPVLTIGAGGVLVELLSDSRTLLLPISPEQVRRALQSLRIFPLIEGYRGRPGGDVEAVVDAVIGIARFAQANAATIREMDINPLIVRPAGKGVCIADALIISEETQ